jgi:hypothetical protein
VTTRGSEAIAITQAKPSETVHVELRFGEGTLRCVGTLRDAAGAAVAGATMEGGGSRTVTPADGTFALTFTRSGIKRIRIAAPDGRKSDRFVDVADGVDLRWDPVLRPMWRIAGRVVDGAGGWENGSALFEVALVPVPPWAWPATPQGWRSTSRDGSFAFENVQPSRYRLVAMAGSMMGSLPVATSAEFDSEQKDFVFRLPATIKPKARVTAKLVDAQSRPIEKAVLCIEPVDNTTTAWAESNAAGIVARGPLAPWRYRFYAKDCPGGLVTDLGERDVVTSDVDLGTVTFAAPGRARMTWTADGDVAPGTAHGTIVSVLADGWRVGVAGAFDFSGPSPASWLLAPGRYVVRATGGTIEGVERTFEVRSGEETAVDVPLRAAPQRRVALRFPLGPPSIGRVRITDAAGGFVHESQLLATDLLVPLAPGRFRVAVDVTETITVSGTLDVPAENAPERLEVVLR